MKFSVKKALLATAAFGIVNMPASVVAQEGGEAAEDADDGAIIVTARKKEENLLEAPLSITAFTAEDILEAGLTDINDIQNFTPGFVFEPFGTTTGRLDQTPRFRGITTNTANPLRQTASVFMDGVYVANGVTGINFNDIQRIEVIKGPQSALYGRSTFGGAINFISKSPGDEFAVDFSASAATRDRYEASLGLEGPIADGLGFRISGNIIDKQGHHRTSAPDGGRLGDQETWSIGGTLFIEPSPNFDAKLRANYFENNDGPPAAAIVGQNLLNCGRADQEGDPNFPNILPGQVGTSLGLQEGFFCGTLPVPQANNPGVFSDGAIAALENLNTLEGGTLTGPRRTSLGLSRESLRLSGQFNVRFPDSSLVFSWLTGYNADSVDQARISEGAGLTNSGGAFLTTNQRRFRDFSQEIRLSGAAFNERVNWSIGGNYFDQSLTSQGGFGTAGGFLFGAPFGIDRSEVETIGVFGSVIVDLTDQFTITGEARYQGDKVTEDEGAFSNAFNSFLPRVIAEFQATPDTLIYASYSEGNLPGGFNPEFIELSDADRALVTAVNPFSGETFEEENLTQYEFGVKHAFDFGSVSAAFYYIEREGQTVRDTINVILTDGTDDFITQFLNIGESESVGAELEVFLQPLEGLTVDGTLAYIDSEFVEFASTNVLRAFGNADASGNRSERFPKWTGSLSWQYESPLNDDWGWFIRNDNSYSGSRFASEVNLAQSEAYFTSNLRLGVKKDGLRIEAFVTNLTDEDAPVAAVRSTDLGAVVSRTNGNRPFGFFIGLRDRRQFGLRVNGSF